MSCSFKADTERMASHCSASLCLFVSIPPLARRRSIGGARSLTKELHVVQMRFQPTIPPPGLFFVIGFMRPIASVNRVFERRLLNCWIFFSPKWGSCVIIEEPVEIRPIRKHNFSFGFFCSFWAATDLGKWLNICCWACKDTSKKSELLMEAPAGTHSQSISIKLVLYNQNNCGGL